MTYLYCPLTPHICKTLSGNNPNFNTNSTCACRQLTAEYPSFLDLPSARLLNCQTGQTTLWVFLSGFSYPRSRTGLCAWTRILLFPHHGSLFHTTMLYLPYLFWHVSRIRNHLHIVELRKPIGWCHDSDPNVNGKHRKSHSASCPLDAKCGSHASQPEPPASHTNPSTLSLQFPSPTFTPISTSTTTISIHTGPGPCGTHALFFLHQRTKDCDSPPLFWKKRQHWIFHQ